MSKTTNKYSPEVRERAVCLVLDDQGQHESRWSAMLPISSKIGCAPQTLNEWAKKAEVDRGDRTGITTEMAEKMKALERENRELKQANAILRKGEAFVRHRSEDNGRAHILPPLSSPQAATAAQWDGARPPTQDMIAFIEENRDIGVEPICKHLPIAPSTFYDHMAKRANPDLLSDRAKRDKTLRPEIERVWDAERQGLRRTQGLAPPSRDIALQCPAEQWMRREGFDVARCTVARLINDMGLEGVIRCKKARTTIPDKALPCPLDKVNLQFRVPAPDMLWVSDFTYAATAARQHMQGMCESIR